MREQIYTKEQNLELRLMKPAEEEKWNQLMKEHHYLGFERLSG